MKTLLSVFLVMGCLTALSETTMPTDTTATTTTMDTEGHEVLGTSRATIGFGDGTTIGAALGYHRLVSAPFQVGADIGYAYTKAEAAATGTHALTALVGPTINFPFDENIRNAIFFTPQAGVTFTDTGAGSSTDFTYSLALGKRFSILDHVTYRPSVSMVKVAGTDANFVVTLLALSILY